MQEKIVLYRNIVYLQIIIWPLKQDHGDVALVSERLN